MSLASLLPGCSQRRALLMFLLLYGVRTLRWRPLFGTLIKRFLSLFRLCGFNSLKSKCSPLSTTRQKGRCDSNLLGSQPPSLSNKRPEPQASQIHFVAGSYFPQAFPGGAISEPYNTSPAPASPNPAENFELNLQNYKFSLQPITPSQLLPRRWAISRGEPPKVLDHFENPRMTPDNAAAGYVPAFTTGFTPVDIIPGWETFLHPQGSMYFYHRQLNILTNTDIRDDGNRTIVTEAADRLSRTLPASEANTINNIQIVIDLRWDTFDIGYYFASLQKRCLFWAQDKYIERLFKRVARVWSYTHIGHLIEAEYWMHYKQFPHVQILREEILREAKGFLLFTAADQTFNPSTTSEYSVTDVDKAMSLMNLIPGRPIYNETRLPQEDPGAAHYTWVVGSLMSFHAMHRFENHHGQHNARWHRDDFPYLDSEVVPGTWFIILSLLLFYTPETYHQSLRNIMSDRNVFFEAWRTFVMELHQEWQGHTIIVSVHSPFFLIDPRWTTLDKATVLLATNMAFLAIPSLDNGDQPDIRSPAQICSYLSIVTSICSILLSQLFSRYHRIKGWEHFDERITNNYDLLLDIGCIRLALMYSLPYALLSWSLICFLVAFLVLCFHGTGTVVRLFIGITSAVILLVMIYCIYRMRGNDDPKSTELTRQVNIGRIMQLFRRYFSLRPSDQALA